MKGSSPLHTAWNPQRFETPDDKFAALRHFETEERLVPLSRAWLEVLDTGKDPDGFYTLAPSLLPWLRRVELAEERRLLPRLSYEAHQLDIIYWDYVENMEPTPELIDKRRRANRALSRIH